MSKLFTTVAIIITITIVALGINKVLSAPDCYYVSQSEVVCDK